MFLPVQMWYRVKTRECCPTGRGSRQPVSGDLFKFPVSPWILISPWSCICTWGRYCRQYWVFRRKFCASRCGGSGERSSSMCAPLLQIAEGTTGAFTCWDENITLLVFNELSFQQIIIFAIAEAKKLCSLSLLIVSPFVATSQGSVFSHEPLAWRIINDLFPCYFNSLIALNCTTCVFPPWPSSTFPAFMSFVLQLLNYKRNGATGLKYISQKCSYASNGRRMWSMSFTPVSSSHFGK